MYVRTYVKIKLASVYVLRGPAGASHIQYIIGWITQQFKIDYIGLLQTKALIYIYIYIVWL
jgi:fucose permease